MISIIITSYKEEGLIGRAIEAFHKALKSSGISEFEIIQISPDKETLEAGSEKAVDLRLNSNQYIQLQDPRKGKPHALNLALDKANGDIVIMSDGDVKVLENSLTELLKGFNDDEIFGVCGQPIPTNEKDNFMGYLAHMLTSVADKKRRDIFNQKQGDYYTSKGYFPMSGYLLAFRNKGYRYDTKYIDDAFISLLIVSEGQRLSYAPEAKVEVRFPHTVKDYLIQRKRNIEGTKKIHEDERFKDIQDERSLSKELHYFLYPIKYASSLKEFIYSFLFYPLRVYTWLVALKPQKAQEHKVWDVASSTKE